MQNMAGRDDADRYVEHELNRCKIEMRERPLSNGEVKTSRYGVLQCKGQEIVLTRGWAYWIVEGNVPYDLAVKIFEEDVGKEIRVAGHCGAPHPDEWSKWMTPDGVEVLSMKQKEELDRYKDLVDYRRYTFTDTPEEVGARYVTSYHIDTELGLYIFANAVKAYNA